MTYLLLAIVGSGVIPVIFRLFENWRINLFWAIPANYVVCVLIGRLLGPGSQSIADLANEPWIYFAVLQGVLLAVNFFLLAHTAQRVGIAVAALASRLSVAIPSVLAFVLYGDSLTAIKLGGLATALIALYLCTAPEKGNVITTGLLQAMPILVFATFGIYFSILKYLQTYYLDPSSYHSCVMSGFVFALLASVAIGRAKGVFSLRGFRMKHVGAGIFLGVINYTAVYALLQVLALKGWQSSQLYPIYSVGVVGVSTVLALICFQEKLSRRKTMGLAVGVLAVALLNR